MIKRGLKKHSMKVVTKNYFPQSLGINQWFMKIYDSEFNLIDNPIPPIKLNSRPTITSVAYIPNPDSLYSNYKYSWNPITIEIPHQTDWDIIEFLRDWMHSDIKYNVSLEYLHSNGNTIQKWTLSNCLIEEMHREVFFDVTVDQIRIKLSYEYAVELTGHN